MMQFDVFVSHSAQDKPTAEAAVAALEAKGVRCWIAPRDVVPGSDWGASIVDAIDNCQVMVLIFSANANESPQIRREVERAVSKGKSIIPVRIQDVVPTQGLAYFMGSVHWLDALTPPLEQHLQRLVASVKALLALRGNTGDAPAPSTSAPTSAASAPPAISKLSSPLPQWQVLLLIGIGVAVFVAWVSTGEIDPPTPVLAAFGAFALVTLFVNWFFPDAADTNLGVKIATMGLAGFAFGAVIRISPLLFREPHLVVISIVLFLLLLAFYLAGKALSLFRTFDEAEEKFRSRQR
jgi:TIR domain